MSSRPKLVVHAHFYQPLRADPWTDRVPPDASAAPARDWTARVTDECYRPISARDTLEHASWNLGPTLTSYLADEAPEVLAGFRAADEHARDIHGGPGIAQAFHHSILPLAAAHDRRTEVRWGLRDFEHRFGRRADAMWLPETAADKATLRVLAEEGVRSTILAPWQSDTTHLESRPYRVDTGGGHVNVLFYDASLSGAVSFEPNVTADADRFIRERIAPRLAGRLEGGDPPVVAIASDGELYGHHQAFRDLFLDRLVAPDGVVPDREFDVVSLARATIEHDRAPHPEIRIRERTSWSCHHGVLRWSGECECAHDGRWKAPLRAAFERLAGAIDTITETLAGDIPGAVDIWGARDRFVDVVIGAEEADAFAARELGKRAGADDRRRLLDVLEAQRWRLAMFSSCGWFWEDPWRPETRQVMRCAARAVRLIDGHAGTTLEHRLLADLETLTSPSLGADGATIYRHALSEIGQPPPHA
jgi:Domain of unknown function (DUF3536)/Glycosyl hydrolase family 57